MKLGPFTVDVAQYLPAPQTITQAGSVVGKAVGNMLYYGLVSYGRLAGEAFILGELTNFFNPKKENEEQAEANWMDYTGMVLAGISSGYLMLTVYNIRRTQASRRQQQLLTTPQQHEHKHGSISKGFEAGSIFIPLALLAYGGSFFFMQKMLTDNQIAIQFVSIPAGVAVGYDSYVLHESHHHAEEKISNLYKQLTPLAKVWSWLKGLSLVVGHGVEAYLQGEAGLRALTFNSNADWANYFRATTSIALTIPVIYFVTYTELHSILSRQKSNQSIYFLVSLLGATASVVHTAGPAMGGLEFASLLKCGIDTSLADFTPECDSSLAHAFSLLPKIGLFGASVVAVGLVGGQGFNATTVPDVNAVATDAWKSITSKISTFHSSHWKHNNRGEEEGLVTAAKNTTYGSNKQTSTLEIGSPS